MPMHYSGQQPLLRPQNGSDDDNDDDGSQEAVSWSHNMKLERTPMMIKCPMCEISAKTDISREMGGAALIFLLMGSYFMTPFGVLLMLVVRYISMDKKPRGKAGNMERGDFIPSMWKDTRHRCRSCEYNLGVRPALSRNVFLIVELFCVAVSLVLLYYGYTEQNASNNRDELVAKYNAKVFQWNMYGARAEMEQSAFAVVLSSNNNRNTTLQRKTKKVEEVANGYVDAGTGVEEGTSVYYEGTIVISDGSDYMTLQSKSVLTSSPWVEVAGSSTSTVQTYHSVKSYLTR
eukprot:PhM_4_TR8400/c0_g1_i1/m.59120